ncbi:MAG: DUF2723 domain-containing protein [Myxococcales bacterium FL481]|nr:MAG: DUF2723 domain-containing protein [Myxococcales bacterium FL481]
MRLAVVVACVAFGWLLLGSSPSHFWLDAGQIAAAGGEFGVMHPPGAPGFLPLVHLATSVPLGSLGFRMTLVSSLFGALTVGLAARLLTRRGAHPMVVISGALLTLGALTFTRHARTLEIYTFGACLLLFTVWGFDPAVPRARRLHRRLLGTMALSLGALGFGDLRLLAVFGLTPVWLRAMWLRQPWAPWAPLSAVAASLAGLLLPLRAATQPVANWGDPSSLGRWWSHLSADSIRHAYADQMWPTSLGPWLLYLRDNLHRALEDVGPVAAVLCLGVFVGPRRQRADVRLATGLVAVAALELFYAVAVNPMGGRDRQTGLALAVVAGLLATLSIHTLSRRFLAGHSARWALAPLVWAAVAGPVWMRSAADMTITRSWGPWMWAREALRTVPPGSVVLTQSDDLSGGLLAARVLEGARPDVTFAPAQHLHRRSPGSSAGDGPFAPAREGRSDADRVGKLLAAWEGPVAFEHAHTGVLAGMPDVPLAWDLPLSTTGAPPRWPKVAVQDRIRRFLDDYATPADRQRVAIALSAYARARVSTRGHPRDFAEAEAVLTAVVRDVAPDHPSALVALGGVYDRLGRRDRAIAVTREALVVEPDRHVALLNLALYLSRDVATLPQARELAERAVFLRPHRSSGWRRLADVAQRQGDGSVATAARRRAGQTPSN